MAEVPIFNKNQVQASKSRLCGLWLWSSLCDKHKKLLAIEVAAVNV